MKLEVQTKESSMCSMGSKVEEMKSKILPQGCKVNFDSQDV
jgi:hypothetical protein